MVDLHRVDRTSFSAATIGSASMPSRRAASSTHTPPPQHVSRPKRLKIGIVSGYAATISLIVSSGSRWRVSAMVMLLDAGSSPEGTSRGYNQNLATPRRRLRDCCHMLSHALVQFGPGQALFLWNAERARQHVSSRATPPHSAV